MKGNEIVLAMDPRGRQLEGTFSGTALPGTLVQIKSGVAPVNGRHTWEVYNRDADGNRPKGPLAVLNFDFLSGKTADDAVTDGERCFVYIPLPGDELNVRWAAAGTALNNAIAIGDIGIPDDGTGLLVLTTGSPEIEPFMAMEAVADVTATGTLLWSIFTGF